MSKQTKKIYSVTASVEMWVIAENPAEAKEFFDSVISDVKPNKWDEVGDFDWEHKHIEKVRDYNENSDN